MARDWASWRMKGRRAALGGAVAAFPLAYFGGSAVHAQSIMRSPNLNIQSRIPTINPTVTPRIDPNIAGTAVTGIGRTTPNLRTSRACTYPYRGSAGERTDRSVPPADGAATTRTGHPPTNHTRTPPHTPHHTALTPP